MLVLVIEIVALLSRSIEQEHEHDYGDKQVAAGQADRNPATKRPFCAAVRLQLLMSMQPGNWEPRLSRRTVNDDRDHRHPFLHRKRGEAVQSECARASVGYKQQKAFHALKSNLERPDLPLPRRRGIGLPRFDERAVESLVSGHENIRGNNQRLRVRRERPSEGQDRKTHRRPAAKFSSLPRKRKIGPPALS